VTITVSTGTFVYTNADGFDEVLVVSGGTVSAIERNTITTGLTSGVFVLRVGDTLTIKSTSAPTCYKQSL
jgi:hypothetical protein